MAQGTPNAPAHGEDLVRFRCSAGSSGRRSSQKQRAVDRRLQGQRCGDVHPEMGNNHPIRGYCGTRDGYVSEGFERDPNYAVEMPKRRGMIEIEERSMSASNSRYLTCHTGDDFDWRFHVGLVGHDNIPWFWNPEEECWRPVAASRPDATSRSEGPPTGEVS